MLLMIKIMNDIGQNYIMQWPSYPIRRFFNKETIKVSNANLITTVT